MKVERDSPRPVTLRAVLLGLVLIPAEVWWLTEIEFVRYSDSPTIPALYFHAVATLLLLLAGNVFLRRVRPRWAFRRGELITVYLMVVVATNLAGHDQLQILFTTLVYVFRYATPENHWAEWIHPYLPKGIMVDEEAVLKPLFTGHATFYTPERLSAWAVPVAVWGGFALVLTLTMLCLGALFRRQWDAERLTYPIAEIPLAATDPARALFQQPGLWVGFAAAAGLQLLNLAHSLYPAVPGVPIGVRYYRAARLPWSAAGSIPVSFFPFALGLTFLLPLQLGFSCWFFFLLSRAEMVLAAVFGRFEWGGFPYVNEQSAGAYFGLCLFVFWAARVHLKQALRAAWGRGGGNADREEPLPYALAVWGFVVGCGLLLGFAVLLGMSGWTALGYFVLFFALVLTVARLRAELGLPTIELYQRGADDILRQVCGTSAFSRYDLTVMTLFFWMNRTHRQFPLQTHVDAFRLGHRSGIGLRSLTGVIVLASVAGIFCAFWLLLHVMYQVGFESAKFTGPALWAFGNDPWRKLARWIALPQEARPGATLAYLFGCSFTLLLMFLRTHWVWWPFHPAGYLVAGSFALMRLWVPLFLSWTVKTLLLRYGGLQAYRAALPFFLGLILGEFSAGFLRTLLDLTFNLYLPAASGIGGL
ncbi:MAG TPA: hypothetical protein EYP85_01065 [Armatimonadetes bacterium]|nr:hypothetical protein [Armatimonadota bacterium]